MAYSVVIDGYNGTKQGSRKSEGKVMTKAVTGVHQQLGSLKVGDNFSGVYYLETSHVRKTVNGKDFTDLALRDKSGKRMAKFWGVVPGLKNGGYVFVAGKVDEYMGAPSFVLANAENADEPADKADYQPVYADIDSLADRLDVLRVNLKDACKVAKMEIVGEVVESVYANGAFFNKLMSVPGSIAPHYGCAGGLLANIVRSCEVSIKLAETYKLDPTEAVLVQGGAMLAIIGGVDAYGFQDCIPVVTTNGTLLGVSGLTMIRVATAAKRVAAERAKTVKDTADGPAIARLLHIVSSALATETERVQPMTKEAMVVFNALRMDRELVSAIDVIANDQNPEQEFTAYDPTTQRRYFRG